jgi:RND family efflux transporter MFP subunit
MRKRISLILAAGLVLPAVVGVVACSSKAKNSQASAEENPSASVALVQRGAISRTLSLAGQFEAYQVVEIHPKVSGFVREIKVDIGDRVRQGQTLAVLEVPELAAQLQGTVAQVAESKEEIVRAEHEVTRAESNYSALGADNARLQAAAKAQPGLIAQQELDDAQSKDLASSAEVDAAKSALAAAKQTAEVSRADNQRVSAIQDYTRVTAPFDGVVVWRDANTGTLLQSGTGSDTQSLPVVTLAQSGLLRLRLPVPEDAVKYVHVGDEMQVRVDAIGRSFTGKVVRFTRNVSLQTRTMQTEIDVENKNLSIDPGMYANTQLQLAHVSNVLTIPVEALILKGNHEVVYVLDGENRIHQRTVQVGLQGSLLAEITSGLQAGDRVILGGQEKFQDGERVQPVFTRPPSIDVTQEQGGEIDLHNEQGSEQ